MIPLEDALFVACAFVGFVLLFVLVFTNRLPAILEAMHVEMDVGRMSLAPGLLGFLALFGVAGVVAIHVLVAGPVEAVVAAVVAGVAGGILVSLVSRRRRRSG